MKGEKIIRLKQKKLLKSVSGLKRIKIKATITHKIQQINYYDNLKLGGINGGLMAQRKPLTGHHEIGRVKQYLIYQKVNCKYNNNSRLEKDAKLL